MPCSVRAGVIHDQQGQEVGEGLRQWRKVLVGRVQADVLPSWSEAYYEGSGWNPAEESRT
jgi:hypothetical protein